VPERRDEPGDDEWPSLESSLWSSSLNSRFPTTRRERAFDVVVVGAGLAGLLLATLLQRSGADVLVLERHTVGGIATRNSTAKISALQGTAYREVRAKRGRDAAAAYAAAQLDAVEGMERLIRDLDIECSLTTAPAYTYATDPESAERAHDEYEAASESGLAVRWVTESELPFPVEGLVRLDDQLHFDPGAACDSLAQRLGPDHVAVHTVVRSVHEDRDGCRTELEDGSTVSADHVVIATQGPISDPAFLANRCKPMQSYALAARLGDDVPTGMYLSCDRSVRSLRPARLNGESIAVIGGEGHPMGDDSASGTRWDVLARWAAEHFGRAEVTNRWATHDLISTDRVPFIGNLAPGARRRWVATGFAKWGMTNSYVAAKLISERIGGGSVPWASTFDATRIASTVKPDLIAMGKRSVQHLVVDRLTRRSEPRCTHQGCVLRRDDAMDSWDCPCHGSRFSADGSVIQGPATRPLEF
jgi:glycine/D-amino acid oxidase-like deaminating enzyme